MASWTLRAANTHLYPGARLTVARGGRGALGEGDDVLIEFADLGSARARVAAAAPGVLAVEPHRTARGAAIDAKRWRIEPLAGGDGTVLRIAGRARA